MNLPEIAWRGGWRDLVTPGLVQSLQRLEARGVEFSWAPTEAAGPDVQDGQERYVFSARLGGVLLTSQDGSETPRQAISEVILGAMTACGAFPGQQSTATPPGRSRLTGTR